MAETAATLLAKGDDELRKILGMDQELEEVKSYLTEGSKLEGKAAKEFQRQLDDMLAPDVDGYRLKWAIEDAQRAAMTPKQRLDSNAPSSVMDD